MTKSKLTWSKEISFYKNKVKNLLAKYVLIEENFVILIYLEKR